MINLVVIGAGGFGRETLDVIEAHNRSGRGLELKVVGLIDDSPSELNLNLLRDRAYSYLGTLEILPARALPLSYLVAIGDPKVRALIAEYCEGLGLNAATLVHPSASIGSEVSLGAGTIICGGVQVSTNVKLGQHVHLNPAAVVGHDTILGDYTSVNPGAVISGNATIGERVLVGAGSIILQGLSVPTQSTIGAGACVTRSYLTSETLVGIPARPQEEKL